MQAQRYKVFLKEKKKGVFFANTPFYAFSKCSTFSDNLRTPVLTLEVAFAERFGF
jgi:hypothetical protein